MLIFEVTSPELTESSGRKYKCTSGPRKGQRVAKIATCSAPIKHRSGSYKNDDEQEPRKYVPKTEKKKKTSKKKLRPKRANIKSESQVNEYGGPGGGNIIGKAKISDLRPGQSATIDNGNGTKTTVDLKKNPQALTKDDKGSIKLNTATKPGEKPNPAKLIKKGDLVDLSNENK